MIWSTVVAARAKAVERGEQCLLRLQVVVDGKLTAWAPQYDSVTLQPTQGRAFELPALVSSESVGVLRYLMRLEQPTSEVRGRFLPASIGWIAPGSRDCESSACRPKPFVTAITLAGMI